MKKQLYKLFFFGFLLFGLTVQGQGKKEKRAERQIEKYAYIDVIKIYESIANKGYESPSLLRNLGDSYYFNGKLMEANIWYSRLFKDKNTSDYLPSEYYYRYAQTLKSIGKYKESDLILEQFKNREILDSRGHLIDKNKDYLEEIKSNSGRYKIDELKINSVYSDYGSTVYKDQFIFTSARDTGGVSKKIHSWTGESFTSLYSVSIEAGEILGEVKPFAREISSKFNESTPVFSPDGQTMYFTRNNFLNGKRGKDSKHTTLLKIYKASLVDGRWTNVESLPFNSDVYSAAHPSLTADGRWMYFASDREGGYGQSDIYKVEILANGTFGDPINLGKFINTEGRESFPFISDDNELYFSTDGRQGLGGLDIYATKINDDGSFSKIQNIGAPANSSMDDFAYYINDRTRKGYLSSNRNRKQGDNIYSFTENIRLDFECLQSIKGLVYDKKTNLALAGANLTLYDNLFNKIEVVNTNDKGEYLFENLKCGNTYRVNSSMQNYNTAEVTVTLSEETGITKVDFGLEKTRVEVKKGDDLFKILKLEPIYFDFDKSNIRFDASLELAKIVEVLREYPKMKIDVRSHTDSRGKDSYNLKLSDRRAKSTINWIIDQGIERDRVSGRGYGETQLINRCSNMVKCSEEEHQENRRSEFIVLDI